MIFTIKNTYINPRLLLWVIPGLMLLGASSTAHAAEDTVTNKEIIAAICAKDSKYVKFCEETKLFLVEVEKRESQKKHRRTQLDAKDCSYEEDKDSAFCKKVLKDVATYNVSLTHTKDKDFIIEYSTINFTLNGVPQKVKVSAEDSEWLVRCALQEESKSLGIVIPPQLQYAIFSQTSDSEYDSDDGPRFDPLSDISVCRKDSRGVYGNSTLYSDDRYEVLTTSESYVDTSIILTDKTNKTYTLKTTNNPEIGLCAFLKESGIRLNKVPAVYLRGLDTSSKEVSLFGDVIPRMYSCVKDKDGVYEQEEVSEKEAQKITKELLKTASNLEKKLLKRATKNGFTALDSDIVEWYNDQEYYPEMTGFLTEDLSEIRKQSQDLVKRKEYREAMHVASGVIETITDFDRVLALYDFDVRYYRTVNAVDRYADKVEQNRGSAAVYTLMTRYLEAAELIRRYDGSFYEHGTGRTAYQYLDRVEALMQVEK